MMQSSSSSFQQRRWRHRGGGTEMSAAQEQRLAMTQQSSHHRAISIRKQRREETLQRKRGMMITTTTTTNQQQIIPNINNDNNNAMMIMTNILESYLQNPIDIEGCSQLRNALLCSTTIKSREFPDRAWLKQNDAKATALIQGLIQDLLLYNNSQDDDGENYSLQEHALTILLHILESDSSSETTTTMKNNDEKDYSYYGHALVTWSEQIMSTTITLPNNTTTQQPNGDDVVSAIMRILTLQPRTKESMNQHFMNIVRLALLVMSNLVWDSPHVALPNIVPHWAILVRYLPHSSYCCATILRQDQIHYGMDFLQELHPQIIAKLLSLETDDTNIDSTSTVVEAAWMVEGLSRREDAAVDCLLQQDSSDPSLIACLIRRLQYLITTKNSDSEFWFPALNSICNMTTSCEGRYVEFFLQYPGFVSIINHLLECQNPFLLPAVVSVANGLLIDAGWPGHASTEIAAPNFLPRLVSILVAKQGRWEWKRDTIHAIVNAVIHAPPPSSSQSMTFTHSTPTKNSVNVTLQTLLETWVWNILEQTETLETNSKQQEQFLEVLLDMLTKSHNDPDVVWPTLQLLDRILRSIPSSRPVFQRVGGVRVLEEGVISFSGPSSHLAAALLDDDELLGLESDDPIVENNLVASPLVVNNQFVFGSSASPNPPFPRNGQAFSTETMSIRNISANGRGRGRVIPAWMQQQQQQH
jgi:hypothetical protein